MHNKGNCHACGLKVLLTPFDHCMYCGTALFEEQRFSPLEKTMIRARQEMAFNEEKRDMEQSSRMKGFPRMG